MRIFYIVFFLLKIECVYAVQDSLIIVYANKSQPFSWLENQVPHGVYVDVMEEVINNRLGIPIKHRIVPWARAQYMVKNNEADGFITVSTKERRLFMNVSQVPFPANTDSIAVRAGHPRFNELKKITNVKDLKPFRIGVHLGDGWAKENLEGMKVSIVYTTKQLLHMLVNARIDIVIQPTKVLEISQKELGYTEQIVLLPYTLDTATYNLMIRKNSSYINMLGRFDIELKKFIDSGDLRKIQDRY